jgi:hypothetical protein
MLMINGALKRPHTGDGDTVTGRRVLAALILCGFLGAARSANADAVVHWNNVASGAIGTAIAAGRPGAATALDFAMVHAAVHDAVQAIVQEYEPYYQEIPGACGSPEAAAAKAAVDVLTYLFPAQATSLDAAYIDFFGANGLALDDPGVLVGQEAAAAIIDLRADSGAFPTSFPPFTGENAVGQWRPTTSYLPGPPPSGSAMAAPWLAMVVPFTFDDPAQFRAKQPPKLRSGAYTRDYNEVKALGSLSSMWRTAEQTDLAYFYSENFFAQWNRALRAIADAHVTDIGDSARLFALANLATADAMITAWDSKIHYNVWRPITAIQEGDDDGNPRTAGDSSWQSLINNPNYPDYISGANIITAAMTKSLALFFGTNEMTFDVTSNAPLAVVKTRTYHRFSDAARDVVDARVYLGIHFRFADTAARTQGRRVAAWVFKNYLRPLSDCDDDD